MIKVGKSINESVKNLIKGKIVCIPTETVYGLGVNALDQKAVDKVFKLKKRPYFDPLICHTNSIEKVKMFVKNFPRKAEILAKKFWPGPLTILLEKKKIVPDITTSKLKTVGFRIPDNKLTLSILEKIDFPIAAPSANPFGYISPTLPKHILDMFKNDISYVLDDGGCDIGIESTIVGFENKKTLVYRVGGITIEKLENVIGEVEIFKKNIKLPISSGMLKNHYSPKKDLIVGEIQSLIKKYINKKIGILSFNKFYKGIDLKNQIILSKNLNLEQASRNLYKSLHLLDNMNIDIILTSLLPNHGIGKSINDRIIKASKKNEL